MKACSSSKAHKNLRAIYRISVTFILTASIGSSTLKSDTVLAEVASGEGQAMIRGVGTIKFQDIEGGFYAIQGEDGQVYDPMNLPDKYKKNGLRVEFLAKPRDDMAGFHMRGMIVELLEIKAR